MMFMRFLLFQKECMNLYHKRTFQPSTIGRACFKTGILLIKSKQIIYR